MLKSKVRPHALRPLNQQTSAQLTMNMVIRLADLVHYVQSYFNEQEEIVVIHPPRDEDPNVKRGFIAI